MTIIPRALPALFFLSVFLTAPASKVALEADSTHEIPRFSQVAKGLYRGGQPSRVDFQILQREGIRSVINLRASSAAEREQEIVQGLGMHYYNIPLNAWGGIPEEVVEQFFQILNLPDHQPLFVHCRRGADRTGVMVGFYRIAFQGWTAEEAFREAREIGMRWWYRNLKSELEGFEKRARTASFTPPTDGRLPGRLLSAATSPRFPTGRACPGVALRYGDGHGGACGRLR